MRKFSLVLIASLSVLALVALSAGAADACDGKTASTASATKVAGAGCSSAKISASVAGAGCSKSASNAVAVETVRMPSGALAVFYNGENEAAVANLHAGFEAKGASFGCHLASTMAENGECTVEAATTETGIMLLVTSEKAELLDEYQSAYQVATAPAEEANDGE